MFTGRRTLGVIGPERALSEKEYERVKKSVKELGAKALVVDKGSRFYDSVMSIIRELHIGVIIVDGLVGPESMMEQASDVIVRYIGAEEQPTRMKIGKIVVLNSPLPGEPNVKS